MQIEGVSPNHNRYGVTAEPSRAQIEERLRSAGAEVNPARQAAAVPAAALLSVSFHVRDNSDLPYYPYYVSVKLKQKLPLPSASQSYVPQTVWLDSRNGIEEPIKLRCLNGHVLALVDGFLAELRAQNAG